MSEDKKEEKKFEVDFSNLKTIDVKKTKGKFKTFTNGSVIQGKRVSIISWKNH